MRLLIQALASALALGGSAVVSHAQTPDSGMITIRVPESIGTFRMIRRRDFPERESGVMLRYQRADSLYADVFVYGGPDLARSCDLACADGRLKYEGDDFIRSFPEFVRLKYVDTIALASDRALTPPPGAVWRLGRHMRFQQQSKGRPQWSDLYIYYLPGFRVKVRATYAPDSLLANAVSDFAAAAAPALAHGANETSASSEDAEGRGIVLSETLPGTPAVVYARLLQVLARQGYTIQDSSFANGRLVTQPRYAWPAGSEKESWHRDESPGFRLTVAFSPKADSTLIQVSGHSPTRDGWTDAKVAQMLQMLSVMEFAAALPDSVDSGKRANRKKP